VGNDNSSLEWVGRGEKERAASRLIALEQEVERLQTRNDDLSALLSVQDKNHLACIEQHEAAEAEVGRLQRDDAAKLAAANRLLAQRDYHRETLRQVYEQVCAEAPLTRVGLPLARREPWLFTDTPPEQKPTDP